MRRSFLIGLFLGLGQPCSYCLASGLATNLKKPAGYENSPGSNVYLGVSGMDAIVVPNVIGRVADPAGMQRFLKGSGFHMKIVRYEASKTMPEGMIVSQIPGALKEVKARGPINVVVSTGPGTFEKGEPKVTIASIQNARASIGTDRSIDLQ